MSDKWVRFGWQGMSVETPPDWELAGVPKNHDPAEGYLRLDDATQPRFELKWSHHPQRKFDLEKTVDDYLKGIRKAYRKQTGDIEIRRDHTLIPASGKHEAFYANRDAHFFSWRGGFRAFGVIVRCHLCKRVVMAQVIGPGGGQGLRQTAVRVFESLRDHAPRGVNLWTAYGLEVETPRRFRLEKTQFLNGYILFSFGDGSRRIAVERYGLADVLIGDGGLDDWFRRTYKKELKGTYLAVDPADVHEGALRLWDAAIGKSWDKLHRKSTTEGFIWRDEKANRIYVTRATGKGNLEALARPVAESIALRQDGAPR